MKKKTGLALADLLIIILLIVILGLSLFLSLFLNLKDARKNNEENEKMALQWLQKETKRKENKLAGKPEAEEFEILPKTTPLIKTDTDIEIVDPISDGDGLNAYHQNILFFPATGNVFRASLRAYMDKNYQSETCYLKVITAFPDHDKWNNGTTVVIEQVRTD
ncbi:MAG: hypothetical protein Q8Q23_04520 [bacterium]|nr:hypothetical protein [bacterium]